MVEEEAGRKDDSVKDGVSCRKIKGEEDKVEKERVVWSLGESLRKVRG